MRRFGCAARAGVTLIGLLGSLGTLAPAAHANTSMGASGPVWSDPVNFTKTPGVTLNDLTCTSAGNCVAVGDEPTSAPGSEPVVAVESNGTWGVAVPITLPGDAAPSGGSLTSVSCTPEVTYCFAVGTYNTTGHGNVGLAVDITLLGVAPISPGGQPLDTAAGLEFANSRLSGISCGFIGDCEAVGSYVDVNTSKTLPLFAEGLSDGTWEAFAVPPPAGASDGIELTGISCSPGVASETSGDVDCQAIGQYHDAHNGQYAWTSQIDIGAFSVTAGTGVTIPMPSDFDPGIGQNPAIHGATPGGISCDAQQSGIEFLAVGCTAELSYLGTDKSQHPLIVPINAGVPGTPVGFPGTTGAFSGISCLDPATTLDPTRAHDTCMAVGSAASGSGGLVTRGLAGAWSSPVTLPASITRVVCTSVDLCVALGNSTAPGTGAAQPYFLYSAPLLATQTTSLPGATVGTPYRATLGATGGAGPSSWSISSGALPDGLSLNPSSGVISGTPATAGAKAFSATVTQAGPPAQTQTATLSIQVSPAFTIGGPTTGTTGATGTTGTTGAVKLVRIKTSGSKAQLTLACAGGPCAGTLTISAIEHLKGTRPTAVVASTKKQRGKTRTKSITLASGRYALGQDATQVVTLTMSSQAATLLGRLHTISGKLSVTPTGAVQPALTKTITFTSPKRKH